MFSPESQRTASLSALRARPFLTPLKRLTVLTFNTMNSHLAFSQFSPNPTSHCGSFFIRACLFALRADATAYSIPQAPSDLEWKARKQNGSLHPYVQLVKMLIANQQDDSIHYLCLLFFKGIPFSGRTYITLLLPHTEGGLYRIATSVWGDEVKKILLLEVLQATQLSKSYKCK